MFSCFHVTVDLPDGGGRLLDDLSFEIEEGEWAEFVGPSGSGKSILYSFLALEARPVEGRLVVAGRNLDRVGAAGFAELRGMFGTRRQSPEFLESRTVLENLVLPLVVRGEEAGAAERAEQMLGEAGLEEYRDVVAGNLAVGERRLLGVLRATIGAPAAVLVDGGVDALQGAQREAAAEVLQEAHREGSTVVLFGQSASEAGPEESRTLRLDRT